MARAQKRHSQALAMMDPVLSFEGLDMMRRRLPSGASPYGRLVECRLETEGGLLLSPGSNFFVFQLISEHWLSRSSKVLTSCQKSLQKMGGFPALFSLFSEENL